VAEADRAADQRLGFLPEEDNEDEAFRAQMTSLAQRLRSAFDAGSSPSGSSVRPSSARWTGVRAKLDHLALVMMRMHEGMGASNDTSGSPGRSPGRNLPGVEHHFIDTARTGGKALLSPSRSVAHKRQLEEAMGALEEVRGMLEGCEGETTRAKAREALAEEALRVNIRMADQSSALDGGTSSRRVPKGTLVSSLEPCAADAGSGSGGRLPDAWGLEQRSGLSSWAPATARKQM